MSIEMYDKDFWDEPAVNPGEVAAKKMVREIVAELELAGPPGPVGPAGASADMSAVENILEAFATEMRIALEEHYEDLIEIINQSRQEQIGTLTLKPGDILHVKLGKDLEYGMAWVPCTDDIQRCADKWQAIVPEGVKVVVTPQDQDLTVYRDADQGIEDRIKQRLDTMVQEHYGNIPVEFSVDVEQAYTQYVLPPDDSN